MSSNTQGYVDEDGLTTKDVRVIVSAFKAMDTENLPIVCLSRNSIGIMECSQLY